MPYTIHIDEWIKKSKEDFYILFVQAWIPFNAWYNKEISPRTARGTDRECINFICQNPNDYKNKIMAYLNGRDRESLLFQQEIVDLHKALLLQTIPDAGNPITFKTISIYDPGHSVAESDFYSVHYKIERISSGSSFQYDVKIIDKGSGHIVFNNRYNNCDVANLDSDHSFLTFSDAIKTRVKKEYLSVDIKAPTNVVLEPIRQADGSTRKPPHCIEYGSIDKEYFIVDKDKIAQVLIQLLYRLRCEIFHGSLNPSEQNMVVFKHAYAIQSMLIKVLN